MTPAAPRSHFDQLTTHWSLLGRAHDSDLTPAEQARLRGQWLALYEYVIRRYLGGALRGVADPDAVDECYQHFCARFLSGAFRGANPEAGSLRKYLCRCLSNLACDFKRKRKGHADLDVDVVDPHPGPEGEDEELRGLCRDRLLQRALARLQEEEARTGRPTHSVLRLRMEHPDWTSEQLAEAVSRGGVARNANWVRQTLFRSRERLGQVLRDEVAADLREPSPPRVDEELAELGLLEFCPRREG